jgi:hypothetical protein
MVSKTEQYRNTQDPLVLDDRYTPETIQSFFDIVWIGDEEECWEWEGDLTKDGYPVVGEFKVRAHRLAFELANEQRILLKRQIHHTCYNRLCVNPFHLVMVTQKEHEALTRKDHFEKIDRMRQERGVSN